MQSHLSMSRLPKNDIAGVDHVDARKENALNQTTPRWSPCRRVENVDISIDQRSVIGTSQNKMMESSEVTKISNSSKYSLTIYPLDHYTCGDCGISIRGKLYLQQIMFRARFECVCHL